MKAKARRRIETAAAPSRQPSTPRMPRGAKPSERPLVTRGELRRMLLERATILAPADIGDLLGEEHILRERVATLEGTSGDVFRAQLDLAIACLRDHADGKCPQIPYYTISLLAGAIAYLADELDLVPDFLPKRGVIDDALVLAMACTLGESGIRRYCAWKGIDPKAALGLIPPTPARRGRRRAATP